MIMAVDATKEIQFEIGHVLFIDIVGYSKLLINEQSEQLQKLKQIVRGTEQFRLAEAEGKLLRFADWRWWRAGFSHQSGSAGFVRAGNCKGSQKQSGASSPHGNSQRPGQ